MNNNNRERNKWDDISDNLDKTSKTLNGVGNDMQNAGCGIMQAGCGCLFLIFFFTFFGWIFFL